MADTPVVTSANQPPLPLRDADPIAVDQERLASGIRDYVRALAAEHPSFSQQIRADRRNFGSILAKAFPKIPGREAEGEALRRLIEDVAQSLPVIDTMPILQADISIASRHLTPEVFAEPHGRAVIGSFDGVDGTLRQCLVPPLDELPSFDYMSVSAGIVVVAQLVPQNMNQFTDMHQLANGAGANLYSERNKDRPERYEDPVIPYIANPAVPIPHNPEDHRLHRLREKEAEETAAALAAERAESRREYRRQLNEQTSEADEMAAIESEHPEAAGAVGNMEEWPGAVELTELETLVAAEVTSTESKEELAQEAEAISETPETNEVVLGEGQAGAEASIIEGAGFFEAAEAAEESVVLGTEEALAAADAAAGETPEAAEEVAAGETAEAVAEEGATAEAVEEGSETVGGEEATEEVAEAETAETVEETEAGGEGVEAEALEAGQEAGEGGAEAEAESEEGEPPEAVEAEEEGNERRWLFSEGVEQQDERNEDRERVERIEREDERQDEGREERREERHELFEGAEHAERQEEHEERRDERAEDREEGRREEGRPRSEEEAEERGEPRALGRENREDMRERREEPEREAERREERRDVEERREERAEPREAERAEREHREEPRDERERREAGENLPEGAKEKIKEELKEEVKEEARKQFEEGPSEPGREQRENFQDKVEKLDEIEHELRETGHEDMAERVHEKARELREEAAQKDGRQDDGRHHDDDIAAEGVYHALQETQGAAAPGETPPLETGDRSRAAAPDSDIPAEPARPAALQHTLDETPSPMGDQIHETVQGQIPPPKEKLSDRLLQDTAMHVLVEHGIPAALANHEGIRELAAAGGVKSALSLSRRQVQKALEKAYKVDRTRRKAVVASAAVQKAKPKPRPKPAPQKKTQAQARRAGPKMGETGD